MSAVDQLITLLKGTPNTCADYLKKAIIETVLDASDEKLLRYIHTILMSAVTAGKRQEDC